MLNGRPEASGRFGACTDAGSYSFFCSRAYMLLFLTREAFFRFSIELRFGDSDGSRSYSFSDPKRFLGETVCSFQNKRGLFVNADESKGEDSLVRNIFWPTLARCHSAPSWNVGKVTLDDWVDWLKLPEFRRLSVEPISESGRDMLLPLVGVLLIRSGETCQSCRQ